ncbi:MAG: tRNA uridine-5-carboxymethylaminomethyl(34) synthesis GTPase MnmE [Caldisericaceae bacterium]|nr:tRNA uridine-5-carboxymethylaminomethyl(34) synthesis GTPase MnmE [Caldisericaceae bacterium]
MNDTIVAISTPKGFGGIGVVRLSGPTTFFIGQKVFSTTVKKPKTVYTGYIFNPDTKERIDTGIAIYFKAPHSYTGEDVFELQMHGGVKNLELVVKILIQLGARLAKRGEFTRRAFLNGKLDLIEAEAVIELIEAKTDKVVKVAAGRLFGGISNKIFEIKKRLLYTISAIEGAIDFPFDVEALDTGQLEKQITDVLNLVKSLLLTYKTGKRIEEGTKVVIAGRTNVGKSTLLNALLKFDRAIVSKIPGTTRDTVEEMIDFFGIPVRFIDTAGVRETKDVIEVLGKERSVKAIQQGDIILFMFDASEILTAEDKKFAKLTDGKDRIIVLNKTDLPAKLTIKELKSLFKNEDIIQISALKKKGIEVLEQIIYDKILPKETETFLITTGREKNCLKAAAKHLEKAKELAGSGRDELVSEELKEVIVLLGMLTGEKVSTEILDTIFSRFCIGK